MGSRPMKPCAWPGCHAIAQGSHCQQHKAVAAERKAEQLKKSNKAYNRKRDESDGFYSTGRWRGLRAAYLRTHPLCAECERADRVTPAVIVDHIQPTKTHPHLALDWSNLRALCRACHNRIGAKVGLRGEG